MIVVDADVLGRNRTGEETYVLNLLRQLPSVAPDLQFAAVTRHPELVPDGVQPLPLAAHSQELRMAWSLPRLLRRLRPELAHFQHALPLGWSGRSVVTLKLLGALPATGRWVVIGRLDFNTCSLNVSSVTICEFDISTPLACNRHLRTFACHSERSDAWRPTSAVRWAWADSQFY